MEELEYQEIMNFKLNNKYPESENGRKSNFRKKCKNFKLSNCDGKKLLCFQHNKELLTVVKYNETQELLRKYHVVDGKHLGINKTRQDLSKKYYWKTRTKDVTKYRKDCSICKKESNSDISLRSEMKKRVEEKNINGIAENFAATTPQILIKEQNPFNWHMVIISDKYGEKTHKGNCAMVLLMHEVTHWFETEAITNKYSTIDIGEFIRKLILKYGFIKEIKYQYSKEDYDAKFIERLSAFLKTKLDHQIEFQLEDSYTGSYYNKYIENFYRIMDHFQDENKIYNWDRYLNEITFAYNTFKDSNQDSPFIRMFHRDPLDPTNLNQEDNETIEDHTLKILKTFKIDIPAV